MIEREHTERTREVIGLMICFSELLFTMRWRWMIPNLAGDDASRIPPNEK